MSKHKMDDGTIVDTDKSSAHWSEATDWNGSNNISRATHSQWDHETLYRSRKGRYYLVGWSQRQGTPDHARFVSNEDATRWLLLMGKEQELPDDLVHLKIDVSE